MHPLPGRLSALVAAALVTASVTWSTAAFGETKISTIAGAETTTGSGLALETAFDEPNDVAALPGTSNNWYVYVVDQDTCVVRRFLMSTGAVDMTIGSPGTCDSVGRATAQSGPWTLGTVTALATTSDNKLLIGERESLSQGRVQLFDPSTNKIVTVAGNSGEPSTCGTVPSTTSATVSATGTSADLCNVFGLGAHPSTAGRFLIVSRSSGFVPEVFEVAAGQLKRVASGNGACSGGYNALSYCFSFARDALYLGSGNEFIVSDSGTGKKNVTKFDSSNQALTPAVVAGGGANYPNEGGTASTVAFKGPLGLAPSKDGGYYLADYAYSASANDGCRVFKVAGFTASAAVTTAAGDGSCVSDDGSRVDNVFASQTHVILPTGLALYPGGLLISEVRGVTHADAGGGTGTCRVRQVDRTTLLTQPPALTNATQLSFSMATLESGAALECNWATPDGPIFYSSCPSNPMLLPAAPASTLAEGSHGYSFNVSTAPKDPTPPQVFWTVDRTLPAAFPLDAPADGASGLEPQPTFMWSASSDANGVARYELWIDGVKSTDAGTATQARAAAALAEGEHHWSVKAFDGAGNVRESETRAFTSSSPPSASFSISPNPVLAGRSVTFDGSGSSDANGPIARYEWDLDGDGSFETDGGGSPTTTRAYPAPQTITVGLRVTDGIGLQNTTTRDLNVTAAQGTTGQLGVTINNGAQYTRTPEVTVTANFPATITGLLFSNDGGFLTPSSFAPRKETKWKLDSSGPERLPKIVYVRFVTGPFVSETHTDDIILDETPPKVDQASVLPAGGGAARVARASKLRSWRVKVKATDSNSGVQYVQIAANKRKPGKLIAYKRKLRVKSNTRPKFIRARDKAGNFSPWRTAKKR